MKKTVFIIFLVFVLVLFFTSCDREKIDIQEPEEPIAEVADPVAELENALTDYADSICPAAFDLWKGLGFFRDLDEEKPITQEFIREVYSNYLLYINKDYDFFDRFVSAKELDSFSENYFGVSFFSLKSDIPASQTDEERGIKLYTHPQLYPSDTTYSFIDTGKEGDYYYFILRLNYSFEGLLDKDRENVETIVRVSFRYEDSRIFFVGQESQRTFQINPEKGSEKAEKTDAFVFPSLCYQAVLHSTRLFHDVDLEAIGGDTLLLKMKKFSFGIDKGPLSTLNEPVKTLGFFGDGKKYSFKLYENGFIPSGSGFAGQTLEEAYSFMEDPEEWKQILETLNASYQDFGPNYGASWLGLINPDSVTDLSIALDGTKATYVQNDRTDEITPIVEKLRGILVENNPSSSAEKPIFVPGTLSLTLDFYTGIQYEIALGGGNLQIYASDVCKTLTYKIKGNDPYDALLPYVFGTQEANYITG